MNAGTGGTSDTETNSCGIAMAHAYSVFTAFELTVSGTTYDMLMVRNPWGVTNYKGAFKFDDAKWTDAVVANVPMGIDPRTSSAAKGIFVLPKEDFKECFEEFSIAHTRSGFSDNWYDALDMDDEWHTYYFTMPEK